MSAAFKSGGMGREPGSSSWCCRAVGSERGGWAIRREEWAAGQTNGHSGSASVCPWMDTVLSSRMWGQQRRLPTQGDGSPGKTRPREECLKSL